MRVIVATKRGEGNVKPKRMDLDELSKHDPWLFIDYIKNVYRAQIGRDID